MEYAVGSEKTVHGFRFFRDKIKKEVKHVR